MTGVVNDSLVVVWLASPRDRKCPGGSQLYRMAALARSMLTVRECLLPATKLDLPTIVFHENYRDEDKEVLLEILPQTKFIEVDFSGNGLDFGELSPGRNKGYTLMCRFWTGMVQKHPALQSYTHYMRLDDDSFFIAPRIQRYAVVEMMKSDYAYRQIFWDNHGHEGLYEFTVDFLKQERLDVPQNRLLEDGKYKGKAIYNNFHLSKLSFWQHPLITKYTDAIESEGGILRKAWLDANIHAMICALIAPNAGLKVHLETSFAYKHNGGYALVGSPWEWYANGSTFVAEPHEWAE